MATYESPETAERARDNLHEKELAGIRFSVTIIIEHGGMFSLFYCVGPGRKTPSIPRKTHLRPPSPGPLPIIEEGGDSSGENDAS